jgi:hypothetical protein
MLFVVLACFDGGDERKNPRITDLVDYGTLCDATADDLIALFRHI